MNDAVPSPERVGSNLSPRRRPRKLEVRSSRPSSMDQGRPQQGPQSLSNGHGTEPTAQHTFEGDDSDLPPLPISEKSFDESGHSFVDRSIHAPSDGEGSLNEQEMKRHFMDIESSFMPPEQQAPDQAEQGAEEQQEGKLGVDDTYLELGRAGHTPPPGAMFSSLKKSGRSSQVRHPSDQGHPDENKMMSEPDTPADAYKTPGPGTQYHEEENSLSDVGTEEASPSSPAAAAAQRGQDRNLPTRSAHDPMHSRSSSKRESSRPQSSGPRPHSNGSTIRPETSPAPQDIPLPETDDQSSTLLSSMYGMPSQLRSRPSYFGNRTFSNQSAMSRNTMSSNPSSNGESINADFALQTGGAMSSSTAPGNARARMGMDSRMPSLGSVVSYSDWNSDGPPSFSRAASGNVLTGRFGSQLDGLKEEEQPETPRANQRSVQAPTDTVLAQRVESIQVPETVARDFRARNWSSERPASSRSAALGGTQDRPRRTLTLKEQNNKVETLTKENFNLKLKVHFLSEALQNRSEEGVQELIEKSVQFQTDLANERKETQSLRRRLRELEKKVQENEQALAEARQTKGGAGERDEENDDDPTLQAEMHEEILYLRQQLDNTENKVTTLSEDLMTKELEKRKMAEHMRSMAGSRGEDTAGMRETMDMWQDLLNAETGRREQAEEDVRKLREELTSLRIERASPAAGKQMMKRRSRLSAYAESEVESDIASAAINGGTPTDSSATLVEQLRHENAELRRDLGAQTSMLTSRNRERERLQQEIEDLKLIQRKSDGARSVAGESIFERSISRAGQQQQHGRPQSRGSEAMTQVTETEREDWERKEGQLRDQNAELRLRFQELERTHNTHLQYVSALEGDFEQMETELNEQSEDLRALQRERDEALQAYEGKEADYEKLEQEAIAEIDGLSMQIESLESQLADARERGRRTKEKLERTGDDYRGLQGELREITQSVMALEDEKQANLRAIQTLEQQLEEAETELQSYEQKCRELDQKGKKLEITQESLHSEITFLREEQEGDKIKIGELEDALNAAQQTVQDEQERVREMEEGMEEERQQRDVLENQSKEEVQKVLDDLNVESGRTKDEVRKLRRALSAKEVESSSWKGKLDELERDLKSLLGEPHGTKQSLLAEIQRLQREAESTANSLDRAKMDLADKDRLLRHRDGLLESTSLESRRLSDLLDKERSSRRHDLEQFERASRGQASQMREIAQHQSRVLELETAYSQDKRKMAALEQQYRDQLSERNNLLLALWNRLSTLCGTEWAQTNSMIDGKVPSHPDVIQRNIPGFNKIIISAVQRIESVIGNFKVRVREVEKVVWKDYQTLHQNLDFRIQRMEGLERAVRDTQRAIQEQEAIVKMQEARDRPTPGRSGSSKSVKASEEVARLKQRNKVLEAELKFHKQHPSALAQQMINNQNAPTTGEHIRRVSSGGGASAASVGKSQGSPAQKLMSSLLRGHSSSAVEQMPPHQRGGSVDEGRDLHPGYGDGARQSSGPIQLQTPTPAQPSEQRWVHRLKELERRLKAEREARLLDRKGARQRLEEGRLENEELKQMLEREKGRRESFGDEEGESFAGSERRASLAAASTQQHRDSDQD
ncbi:hypothetical protein D0866_00627 [Hortaea werneckii]|uniref:Centrosomin N-terminal motif 1 domain-containing protein n=1 Tax=Hortaea werneckii TaxID=91943 RepID=A0A3M7BNL0_HORWE|nr:hypothetical protein D0866_00627 [Hortaea werneckii]